VHALSLPIDKPKQLHPFRKREDQIDSTLHCSRRNRFPSRRSYAEGQEETPYLSNARAAAAVKSTGAKVHTNPPLHSLDILLAYLWPISGRIADGDEPQRAQQSSPPNNPGGRAAVCPN
jgi:hypothetical protein